MIPSGREPLKFGDHPKDQYKTYGSEVVFSVSASGAGTISYQWIKDEMDIVDNLGPEYIGIDTPNLIINWLSQQHVGQYSCRISNEDGCKISSPAQLRGMIKGLPLAHSYHRHWLLRAACCSLHSLYY